MRWQNSNFRDHDKILAARWIRAGVVAMQTAGRCFFTSRVVCWARSHRLPLHMELRRLQSHHIDNQTRVLSTSHTLLISSSPSKIQASALHTMPTDEHGQTHAGTIGLFDDADEYAATTLRSERRERRELESQVRRLERRADRQRRKEVRAAERKSKLPSWLARVFGSDEKPGDGGDRTIKVTEEWVVVRRPATPEPEYTARDIDPVDSLWLRECGMVRVKSDDAGGCHIVPKSNVQKSD